MNTKTLSARAMSVIDQYRHFKFGNAVCSVPYFNNKTVRAKAALRTEIGKGSPKDIFDEAQSLAVRNHIPAGSITGESLKKLLTDNNIGIDCSGFAYYALNAEGEEAGKGPMDRHIRFTACKGIIGKIRCRIRPAENCDVATLADNENSRPVPIKEVSPGDIITMTNSGKVSANPGAANVTDEKPGRMGGSSDRDHILVIHQVEYQNFAPVKIHYSHAIAYPEDGIYGTGIRQGHIEIIDPDKSIAEQHWLEDGNENADNRLFVRVRNSVTEIRRLNWF